MADGDVVLNRNFEVDAEAGTRVELFAVERSLSPDGYDSSFQYYAPEEGEQILRYDNAHESDIGPHHRHHADEVTGIEFEGLQDHVAHFRKEVTDINARR